MNPFFINFDIEWTIIYLSTIWKKKPNKEFNILNYVYGFYLCLPFGYLVCCSYPGIYQTGKIRFAT